MGTSKWVPVNLMLVVTLHTIKRGIKNILVASCYRNRDKFRPDGPLGLYAKFTLFHLIGEARLANG